MYYSSKPTEIKAVAKGNKDSSGNPFTGGFFDQGHRQSVEQCI